MSSMLEKYQAAEKLLVQNTKKAVLNGKPEIIWSASEEAFYFPKETRGEKKTEISWQKMDCTTQKISPLFDEAALKEAFGKLGITEELCLEKLREEENGFQFEQEGKSYLYKPQENELIELGYVNQEAALYSEHYKVFVQAHNLYAERLSDHEQFALTVDGEQDNGYGEYAEYSEAVKRKLKKEAQKPGVLFSPDGKKILTYRLDQRRVRELFVIQSFDEPGRPSIRPRLHTYKCPFPEDEDIPKAYLMIIDLETKEIIPVKWEPFLTGYGLFGQFSTVALWKDENTIVTTWVSRGSKRACMLKINAQNGECTVLVEEAAETFLNLGTHGELDGFGSYAFSNYLCDNQKLAFWQSERDDLARYFAYDAENQQCLGAITPEDILAASMVSVDEENQWIYFIATNLKHCSDPYYENLCRVHFDGSDFKCLTPEDAYHEVSLHGDYFVDTYSRVDLPPVTVLRKTDGTLAAKVIEADITQLLELGYIFPERFSVKASDGITDLYGILIRPQMTEGETVPVIDHMYGGMQCYYVPKKFTWDHEQGREIFGGLESYAKLGIAGIMLDGLGTPGRGKKLHELSYHNIHGCAGLKDHVYAAKELKEKYPFLDFEKVGIWGNSGGGCATSRAMLEYPDFYKVGVSSAGNHDQRMYNNSWTERYYGLYDEKIYLAGDNTALAANLKGKLLIVHGAMDDNVSLSQSIRLIDALIQADKDFDFFILPRIDHNVPADPYFMRRKMDYFVEHLLKETPPQNYHFTLE